MSSETKTNLWQIIATVVSTAFILYGIYSGGKVTGTNDANSKNAIANLERELGNLRDSMRFYNLIRRYNDSVIVSAFAGRKEILPRLK